MIVVFSILNALADAFGLDAVMNAVRAWIGQKDAQIFLAANPGLAFTNEGTPPTTHGGAAGLCPTPSACADGSGLCAAPSGGGAALRHTPNASGRYSLYSGIPDAAPSGSATAFAETPYDAPTDADVAAVAEALASLSAAE